MPNACGLVLVRPGGLLWMSAVTTGCGSNGRVEVNYSSLNRESIPANVINSLAKNGSKRSSIRSERSHGFIPRFRAGERSAEDLWLISSVPGEAS